MIPEDYVLLARAQFDDFGTSVLEGALRSVPVKDRRDRMNLVFLVSQNTYHLYLEALATRVGDQADIFFDGSQTLTYGGCPVQVEEEIPDGMVEIYGPQQSPVLGWHG